MQILLLGSGGREHALAWKMCKSPLCTQLYIAPGNAGTVQCGKNVDMAVNDFEAIRLFVLANKIDMVVVGPEDPLVNGIYDYFKADASLCKVMVIGPSKAAAQLEGSKAFAKAFMQRHHIPTAAYREFDRSNFEEGVAYLQQHELPVVLKADGLAAGKAQWLQPLRARGSWKASGPRGGAPTDRAAVGPAPKRGICGPSLRAERTVPEHP